MVLIRCVLYFNMVLSENGKYIFVFVRPEASTFDLRDRQNSQNEYILFYIKIQSP